VAPTKPYSCKVLHYQTIIRKKAKCITHFAAGNTVFCSYANYEEQNYLFVSNLNHKLGGRTLIRSKTATEDALSYKSYMMTVNKN
jgi:hypothetical protein